eukprot:4328178-Pleurochrysis_carterae.AAC.6
MGGRVVCPNHALLLPKGWARTPPGRCRRRRRVTFNLAQWACTAFARYFFGCVRGAASQALATMIEHRFRHLPVLDGDGEVRKRLTRSRGAEARVCLIESASERETERGS